jgi:choline transport protein
LNAVLFTLLSTTVLCLIIIGSSTAFNIIISLGGASLSSSNIIVIGCMVRKRLVGEHIIPSRFSLGRWGLVVNLTSLCYLLLTTVMILFPTVPNPTLIQMNWASAIFGSLVIFSIFYYFFHGRKNFDGPVAYVKHQ